MNSQYRPSQYAYRFAIVSDIVRRVSYLVNGCHTPFARVTSIMREIGYRGAEVDVENKLRITAGYVSPNIHQVVVERRRA